MSLKSMSLYNTGDIVRCVDAVGYERFLTVGKEYSVVEHVNPHSLKVIADDDTEFGFYPARFVPVAAAPTFVRYNGMAPAIIVGRWYKVVRYDNKGPAYEIQLATGPLVWKGGAVFDDLYYGPTLPDDGWSSGTASAIAGHTGDILITDDLVDATAYAWTLSTDIGASRPEPANPELDDLKQHRYTPETY